MGRRGLKIKRLEPADAYFVLVNEGDGLKHLYTFNVTKCQSGVLYEMFISKSGDIIADYENRPIYSLLNNGDGYTIIDMDFPIKEYKYDEFSKTTLFFTFIQEIEATNYNKYYYEIHKSVIFHQGKL